jgi:hypothetical protein
MFVICSIELHWTQQGHCLKPDQATYTFWWPLTIIRSGAKQEQLLTMERRQQPNF